MTDVNSEPGAGCRALGNQLNAESIERLRTKNPRLPEQFGENLLKCLPVGIEALQPSFYLLSKVTFRSGAHDPVELFALWRRISNEVKKLSPFVKANLLKASSNVCQLATLPGVFKASVQFETLYAVLMASIEQKVGISDTFLIRLNSLKKPLNDCELIDLAEKLLINDCWQWSRIVLLYPCVLGIMFALNQTDEFFILQVRALCEKNPNFNQIVAELRTNWFPFV